MSRLVILGIDALDAGLIERWKADLPNFSRITSEGCFARLESTMPADSIPAWVTIYTGMQPWQHGIIDSMDYMDIKGGGRALDTSVLIGKTFWDIAGAAGKRVCVINPLLAYPVWPVNGVMVNGPVFITGEAQAYPPEILSRYAVPELGGMVDFPGKKDLAAFLERTVAVTRDQARFGLELMETEKWDVFFLCFLTLDRIMHFLWRYTDPSDPTYPGAGPFRDSIRDAFRMFDAIVGDMMNRLGPDQTLIVVSDHGHMMRPARVLYVNEMLRRDGLLKTRESRIPGLDPVVVLEKVKTAFLRTMQRLNLEDMVYRIAALIPKDKRKQLKTSSYAVTREGSLAWVSDVGGGTSFGGIEVSKPACRARGMDYEATRKRLIEMVSSVTDRDGALIARWVRRREDVFEGRNVEKYPDVVFELRDDYGVDRTLFCGTTGTSSTHKKVSGGHSKYGVLMLFNTQVKPSKAESHISEVFPLIKQVLDLK